MPLDDTTAPTRSAVTYAAAKHVACGMGGRAQRAPPGVVPSRHSPGLVASLTILRMPCRSYGSPS